MSLSIEQTKNGKPHILYNENKYRESHSLKNGERAWRCLGRSCTATVRTDADVTRVVSASSRHQGSHPVTMRTLTLVSTPLRRSPLPTRTPAAESEATRLNVFCSVLPSASSACAPSPAPSSGPPAVSPVSAACASPAVSSALPVCVSTPNILHSRVSLPTALEDENVRLKEQLFHLEDELKRVLDHSIESDARLLKYTDEIFVPKSQLEKFECTPTVDCAVQCDTPTAGCCAEDCVRTQDLVASLRITIEVLEAEVRCLRAERKKCECGGAGAESGWTTVAGRGNTASVSSGNRKSAEAIIEVEQGKSVTSNRKKHIYTKRSTNRLTTDIETMKQKKKRSLGFNTVCIRGDSHARHIAGLVGGRVDSVVNGECRPGGKLRSIITHHPPTSTSGRHCKVLIVGTNDLADNAQHNIYSLLEEYLTSQPPNTCLIIVTIPHRQDLPPDDNINQETVLVNAYIEELAARHNNRILDFSRIGRSFFTRHGMHLTWRGKRRLAGLIVESLLAAGGTDAGAPQPTVRSSPLLPVESTRDAGVSTTLRTVAANTETFVEEPLVLHHNTFADAVKNSPAKNFFLPKIQVVR